MTNTYNNFTPTQPNGAPNFNNPVQPVPQAPISLFPQPIGNIYSMNTASDIGNIPIGTGISVGLCIPESILYIKSLQNGTPMLLGYKLCPLDGAPAASAQPESAAAQNNTKLNEVLERYSTRIEQLENQIGQIKNKLGGKVEWQI